VFHVRAHRSLPRPRQAGVIVATVVLGSFAAWLPAAEAQTRPEGTPGAARVLHIQFDERVGTTGGTFISPVNSGYAGLSVSVESIGGGEIVRRARAGADNGAARMPHDSGATDAPRAVVAVVDQAGSDELDPARRGFTFGADFTLDSRSEATRRGSTDNGDNLVQRGLYNAATQYKLQLDRHRVLCRIRGRAGAVEVTSAARIESGVWYRVRCTRSHRTATLSVTSWTSSGDRTTAMDRARGPTGAVNPYRRSVPLSVGGKLSPDGHIVASTDQFNGRIDNVVMRTR
jgi:hypothetical protein